jgi:hypothetical protein
MPAVMYGAGLPTRPCEQSSQAFCLLPPGSSHPEAL